MGIGSRVVYIVDPLLFGIGVLNRILKDGLHEVIFEDCTELFRRRELELEDVYLERKPAGAGHGT